MTMRNHLSLIVYSPALVANDGRPLAVVQAMERALPGLRLEWKVAKDGRPIHVPQRDAWLAEPAADGGFPLVCNGDESYPITVYGLKKLASQAPGRQPMLSVHAKLPLDETGIAAAANILEAVAEGARAFWGRLTPFNTGVEIAHQTSVSMHEPQVPPRGLPALKLPEKIRSPEIPQYLGWLNYWSPAAARAIGFPDPARDADLLSRSRRTAADGWIVRLTEAPLDLDLPAHLDALLRAYERFPEIGGRSSP